LGDFAHENQRALTTSFHPIARKASYEKTPPKQQLTDEQKQTGRRDMRVGQEESSNEVTEANYIFISKIRLATGVKTLFL
jgi:hypothetical protein